MTISHIENSYAPLVCNRGILVSIVLGVVLSVFPISLRSQTQFPPDDLDLYGVWGTSSSDVWVAGASRKEDEQIGLYYFDGSGWSPGAISETLRNELFPDQPTNQLIFRTISGNATNNIYAVLSRFDDEARRIVRFDGTQWDIHGFLPSEKLTSSYVSPVTGSVFLGGRGLAGGNSIIRRALGAVASEQDPSPFPYEPAGIAFELIVSGIPYGNGVIEIDGFSDDGGAGEVFFASTSGMFRFEESALEVSRPLIEGFGTFVLEANEVVAISNLDGQPDILVANNTGVAAFKWDGSSLIANGDTGAPPPIFLGDSMVVTKLSATRTDIGGGRQGEVENVVGTLRKISGGEISGGGVVKYNFSTQIWEELESSGDVLNDIILFEDGAYFAVGENGAILFNEAPLQVDFEWTGNVNDNWHADPNNWKVPTTGEAATSIPGDGENESALIVNANVVLDTRATSLSFLDASGSLAVTENLTLALKSNIENLDLNASLDTSGELVLSGQMNYWRSGTLSGSGSMNLQGSQSGDVFDELILDADGETLRLDNTLSINGDSQLILRDATLDLSSIGKIENRSGIFNTILLESGIITDSGSQPSIINRNTLEKRTDATATLDAFLESKAEGSMKVFEGTLIIDDPANIESNILVSEGATLEFGQALQVLGDVGGNPFEITGGGRLVKRPGSLLLNGGGETRINLSGPLSTFEVQGGVDIDGQDDALIVGGNLSKTGNEDSSITSKSIEFPSINPSSRVEIENGGLTLDGFLALGRSEILLDSGSLTLQNSEDPFPSLEQDIISVDTKYRLESGSLNVEGDSLFQGAEFNFQGGLIMLGLDFDHEFNKSSFMIDGGPVIRMNSKAPQSELDDAGIRFVDHAFYVESGKIEFLSTTELKNSDFNISENGSVEQKGDVRIDETLQLLGLGSFSILSGSLKRKTFSSGERSVKFYNELQGDGLILDGGTLDGTTEIREGLGFWKPSAPIMLFDNNGAIRLNSGLLIDVKIKNGFQSLLSEINPGLILASEPNHSNHPEQFHISDTPQSTSDSEVIPTLTFGAPESLLVMDRVLIVNSKESSIIQEGPVKMVFNSNDVIRYSLMILNNGQIKFTNDLLGDTIIPIWTIENGIEGHVDFSGNVSVTPELRLTNEGIVVFGLEGEVVAMIENSGTIEVSGSVDFSESTALLKRGFLNSGKILFKSGISNINTEFQNLGTVTVETGAVVNINKSTEVFSRLQAPNDWNVEGGKVVLKENFEPEPQSINTMDSRLSMIGVESELNDLPSPIGPFAIINNGRLTLGDIVFTVKGDNPLFTLKDYADLVLLPGATLSASALSQDEETVITQYAGSEIDAQFGSFNGEHRIIGDVFGSSQIFPTNSILPLSQTNQIIPNLDSDFATFTGDYNLDATSRLVVAVGGTELGTGYSRLTIGGAATLNGTLTLLRDPSFPFVESFTADIIQAASVTGNFSSVVVIDPSGRRQYETGLTETGLTVSSSTLAVATFEDWRQAVFTTEELANEDISAPSADADSDNLTVFEEYVHDGHPDRIDKPALDTEFIKDAEGKITNLIATFPWAKGMSDVDYELEISRDLVVWETLEAVLENAVDQGPSELITLNAAIEFSESDKLFVRLNPKQGI